MSHQSDLVTSFVNTIHALTQAEHERDQAIGDRDRARDIAAALWDEQCQHPIDCQPSVDSQDGVDSGAGNTP